MALITFNTSHDGATSYNTAHICAIGKEKAIDMTHGHDMSGGTLAPNVMTIPKLSGQTVVAVPCIFDANDLLSVIIRDPTGANADVTVIEGAGVGKFVRSAPSTITLGTALAYNADVIVTWTQVLTIPFVHYTILNLTNGAKVRLKYTVEATRDSEYTTLVTALGGNTNI